jgi:hypothetical protein
VTLIRRILLGIVYGSVVGMLLGKGNVSRFCISFLSTLFFHVIWELGKNDTK